MLCRVHCLAISLVFSLPSCSAVLSPFGEGGGCCCFEMGACNGGLFIVNPAWPWFGQQLITNKYILDPGLVVVWSLSWYCVWASVSLPLESLSLWLWHAATHYAMCVCARACVYLCVEMHYSLYTTSLSYTHTQSWGGTVIFRHAYTKDVHSVLVVLFCCCFFSMGLMEEENGTKSDNGKAARRWKVLNHRIHHHHFSGFCFVLTVAIRFRGGGGGDFEARSRMLKTEHKKF